MQWFSRISCGLCILSGDTATVSVSPTTGLNTTEAGSTTVFTVVLDAQPSADVTLGVTSTDEGEGVLSSSSLTFAVGQWNISQTMTVTGVDDVWVDGDILYNVTMSDTVSLSSNFNDVPVSDVRGVINIDGTVQFSFVKLMPSVLLLQWLTVHVLESSNWFMTSYQQVIRRLQP
jgi:hypothetical protein